MNIWSEGLDAVARPVVPDAEQIGQLEQWSRGRLVPARLVERALIVWLAAKGKLDIEIGAQLSISPPKAARWRMRFLDAGLEGLKKDAPGARPHTENYAGVGS
jgi:hypothetical protein